MLPSIEIHLVFDFIIRDIQPLEKKKSKIWEREELARQTVLWVMANFKLGK